MRGRGVRLRRAHRDPRRQAAPAVPLDEHVVPRRRVVAHDLPAGVVGERGRPAVQHRRRQPRRRRRPRAVGGFRGRAAGRRLQVAERVVAVGQRTTRSRRRTVEVGLGALQAAERVVAELLAVGPPPSLRQQPVAAPRVRLRLDRRAARRRDARHPARRRIERPRRRHAVAVGLPGRVAPRVRPRVGHQRRRAVLQLPQVAAGVVLVVHRHPRRVRRAGRPAVRVVGLRAGERLRARRRRAHRRRRRRRPRVGVVGVRLLVLHRRRGAVVVAAPRRQADRRRVPGPGRRSAAGVGPRPRPSQEVVRPRGDAAAAVRRRAQFAQRRVFERPRPEVRARRRVAVPGRVVDEAGLVHRRAVLPQLHPLEQAAAVVGVTRLRLAVRVRGARVLHRLHQVAQDVVTSARACACPAAACRRRPRPSPPPSPRPGGSRRPPRSPPPPVRRRRAPVSSGDLGRRRGLDVAGGVLADVRGQRRFGVAREPDLADTASVPLNRWRVTRRVARLGTSTHGTQGGCPIFPAGWMSPFYPPGWMSPFYALRSKGGSVLVSPWSAPLGAHSSGCPLLTPSCLFADLSSARGRRGRPLATPATLAV